MEFGYGYQADTRMGSSERTSLNLLECSLSVILSIFLSGLYSVFPASGNSGFTSGSGFVWVNIHDGSFGYRMQSRSLPLCLSFLRPVSFWRRAGQEACTKYGVEVFFCSAFSSSVMKNSLHLNQRSAASSSEGNSSL